MNKDTAAMMGLLLGAGVRFGYEPRHPPMSSEVHLVNILFPDRASMLIAEAMEGDRNGFDRRLREIRQREQAKA